MIRMKKKSKVAGSEVPMSIPRAGAILSRQTIYQWIVKHWKATEGNLKEPRASLDSLINGCLRLWYNTKAKLTNYTRPSHPPTKNTECLELRVGGGESTFIRMCHI